ncbi:MAG: hypothetical protein P4L51_06235 [Puia sp.]|nr:hypothetical protein [Puia sp.]
MELLTPEGIKELLNYFEERKDLPDNIALAPGTKITDMKRFIDTSLMILKSEQPLILQRPVAERLVKLRILLTGKE